jgi:hypothetical protein
MAKTRKKKNYTKHKARVRAVSKRMAAEQKSQDRKVAREEAARGRRTLHDKA